jgi:hypothetical protein
MSNSTLGFGVTPSAKSAIVVASIWLPILRDQVLKPGREHRWGSVVLSRLEVYLPYGLLPSWQLSN